MINMTDDKLFLLVKDIFYNEVVVECDNKTLEIDDFRPTLYFKTKSSNNDYMYDKSMKHIEPLLIIDNKEEFDKYLFIYVKKALMFYADNKITHNNLKYIISLVFVNATSYDLSNPIIYLRHRINMLNNEIKYNSYDKFLEYNVKTEVVKENIVLESPYSFRITLSDDINIYELPRIMFGIDNNIAYVYAIQNKFRKNNDLKKKINRILFKFNKDFTDESDNYFLNGKDVTMSFIASIIYFIKYLNSINISSIKIVPIMPIRYNSHYESNNRRLEAASHMCSEDEYNKYEMELKEKDKLYDDNIFMKIVRTFYRISMQGDVVNINFDPLSLIDGINISIDEDGLFNNELMNEIYNGVCIKK